MMVALNLQTKPQHKPTILVADDDRLVLALITMGLEKAGFSLLKAETGEAAVEVCQRQLPDLILMDIRMPGIGGIDAARKISQFCNAPIVFLSAYDDIDVVEQAIAQGGMGYLVKPFDVHQLVPQIYSALARAADLNRCRDAEKQLVCNLQCSRKTSMAVGILMERFKLNADEAFTYLRQQARPKRKKLFDVANEIFRANDERPR